MRTDQPGTEASFAPLLALTGAPGAGKTTLLPALVRLGNGLVVMDIDELLEDGNLLGVPIARPAAEPNWPGYDRLWRRITAMTRRSGHPVLFLCPNTPDEVPEASAWLLLDCPDDVRVRRLRARGWDAERIDEALADAADYRARISEVVRTDQQEPEPTATEVLAWVQRRTGYSQPSN